MKNNTKTWKIAGTFKSYEAADLFRKSLLAANKHGLVKVRRGAKKIRF